MRVSPRGLRDARFAPGEDETPIDAGDGDPVLPVEICGLGAEPDPAEEPVEPPHATDALVVTNRVDITLSDGLRIGIEGPAALSAVAGLVQGLMA